jgi:HAD superfamily hydrolase (TIGR01490 family)
MGTISSENNLKGKSYIVFFDLDDTLIGANSGKLLVRGAYERGMMSLQDIIKALWLSLLYKFRLMNPQKIIAGMLQWLAGMPEKRIIDLSSEVFEMNMIHSIYQEARSEIRKHKDQNAAVVLLSSALYQVCRKVADHLDLDDIICTELEIDGDCFTGRPLGKICYGNEKLLRLKKYCEKINSKTSDVWYYADSISDLPVLGIVGYPVCINPDRQLWKIAKKRNWKVFDWKQRNKVFK